MKHLAKRIYHVFVLDPTRTMSRSEGTQWDETRCSIMCLIFVVGPGIYLYLSHIHA
jgi:hypothetical protein